MQKKFMFQRVFHSGENYTDRIRLYFSEMVLDIIFSHSSLKQNNLIERKSHLAGFRCAILPGSVV